MNNQPQTPLNRQKAAEECLSALLTGLKQFFEGDATLKIGELDIKFCKKEDTK